MPNKFYTGFLPATFYIILGILLIWNAGYQDEQTSRTVTTAPSPSPSSSQVRPEILEVSIYYNFFLGLGFLFGGTTILAFTGLEEETSEWSTMDKTIIAFFGVLDFVFLVVAGVLGTIWGFKLLRQPHADLWSAQIVMATGLSLCVGLPTCCFLLYVSTIRRPDQIAPGVFGQNDLQV